MSQSNYLAAATVADDTRSNFPSYIGFDIEDDEGSTSYKENHSSAMLAVQSRENNLPSYCGFDFDDDGDATHGHGNSSLPSYIGFDYDESAGEKVQPSSRPSQNFASTASTTTTATQGEAHVLPSQQSLHGEIMGLYQRRIFLALEALRKAGSSSRSALENVVKNLDARIALLEEAEDRRIKALGGESQQSFHNEIMQLYHRRKYVAEACKACSGSNRDALETIAKDLGERIAFLEEAEGRRIEALVGVGEF